MAKISCEVVSGDCSRFGGLLCGRCERARVFLTRRLEARETSRRKDLYPSRRPVYQVVGVEGGEGERGGVEGHGVESEWCCGGLR